MSKLRKFTLSYDEKEKRWKLKNEETNRTLKKFEKKETATKKNVLKKILGEHGGSVKIKKKNNKYQEERTFPRSADPMKSKG